MADDKGELGDISVEMGDGNTVGHIGHKITYQAPPPPPNAIYQNGNVVGEFEGQPSLTGNAYSFSKLFVGGGFDASAEFQVQGIRLVIEKVDSEYSASLGGRPPLRTLWQAVCRIV